MLSLRDKNTLQIEFDTEDEDGTPYFSYKTLKLTKEIRNSVRRIFQLKAIDAERFEDETDEEINRLINMFDGPSARSSGRGYWTLWDDVVDIYRYEFVEELVDLLHPVSPNGTLDELVELLHPESTNKSVEVEE